MVASHISRECWYMVKPILKEQKLMTGKFLGVIDFVFLFTYGCGYFAAGVLGDKLGLVRVISIGMICGMVSMLLVTFT